MPTPTKLSGSRIDMELMQCLQYAFTTAASVMAAAASLPHCISTSDRTAGVAVRATSISKLGSNLSLWPTSAEMATCDCVSASRMDDSMRWTTSSPLPSTIAAADSRSTISPARMSRDARNPRPRVGSLKGSNAGSSTLVPISPPPVSRF